MTEINLLKPHLNNELILDVNKSVYRSLTHKYLVKSILLLAGCGLLGYLNWRYQAGEFLMDIAIIAPLVGFAYVKAKTQSEFMEQFALSNNFSYSKTGSFAAEIGTLFKKGHGQSLHNLIIGKYQNNQFRLFNYKYCEGSGKSRKTYHFTVVDLEFKMDLPRLYLDAHKGQWFKDTLANGLTYLPLSAAEFESKFKLYITPGSQITALQVFTPDLMAELLDFGSHFDIELIGHQIYIYRSGEVGKAKELADMYKVASHIIANMGREAEKIRPM